MKYALAALGIFFGIVFVLAQLLVYKIPSDCMMPHIKLGSYLVVIDSEYSNGMLPKNGQVVMYQTYKMDKPSFARIIGCPGDTVSLSGGSLTLNGNTYREPYIDKDDYSTLPKVTVPAERYLLLNDNRAMINDSRDKNIGMIRKENIKGRVVLVLPHTIF